MELFEVMLVLNEQQLTALATAQKDFSRVGLTISTTTSTHIAILPKQDDSLNGPSLQVVLAQLRYKSPLALFLPHTTYQLNRKGYVHAILDHPLGAVVEYPQSGHSPGQAVAHRFTVDSFNCINPRDNIQYSLGGTTAVKGSRPKGNCYLFSSAMGKPLPCIVTHIGCE